MLAPNSLISELEAAVQSGALDKRIETMKRVTDLFLINAKHLNEKQVGLFDDVLLHLTKKVETKALAELSQRLAPAPNAPNSIVQHLARHDDIVVAGPVLSQSERLSASDLIEIAKNKGNGHLLAISGRPLLAEPLTDILLERGSNEVFSKLAENHGARFSKTGFATLVNSAKSNEGLAEKVGQRIDVPPKLLHELVSKATDAVRIRLLATAPAEMHTDIKRVLATISNKVIQEVKVEKRDCVSAREFVLALQRDNQLNDAALCDFATWRKVDELIVALALMTSMKFELIEVLMRAIPCGGLLFACKAANLNWTTVDTILRHRLPDHPIGSQELAQAKTDFSNLTRPTAARLLGFWQAQPDLMPS